MKDENSDLTNNEKANEEAIKLGSIVATFAHPFSNERNNEIIKVAAYNQSTPPLMVVVEKNGGGKIDTETGEQKNKSFRCLFYSNKKGGFVDYWFKRREIKLIVSARESNLYEKNKNLITSELKKELKGKQVVLHSVDLELNKKQVYWNKIKEEGQFKEKALLDFLPPVGTIIDVSRVKQPRKYDEQKKSLIISDKSGILIKVRWYKDNSAKFSEQDVPLVAFKKIPNETPSQFQKGQLYQYDKPIEFEIEGESKSDNKLTKKIRQPLELKDIIFNHYYYEYRFENLFTKGIIKEKGDNNQDFKMTEWEEDNTAEVRQLVSVSFTDNHPIFLTDKENMKEWEEQWYKIEYRDRGFKYTVRIIYVREVHYDIKGNAIGIEANCLLRNGNIRFFRTDGIMRYEHLKGKMNDLKFT